MAEGGRFQVAAATERAILSAESFADATKLGGEAERDAFDDVFERLFLDNYPRVVAVLVRITGERSRAEELAIDVFWRYYRHCFARKAALAPDANVAGWLYRTATRIGIDSLRAEARRGKYEQRAASFASRGGDTPFEDVLRGERQGRIRQALAKLRPEQSQLLILRASGFSYGELSDVFNVKRGSVGTMLVRAETAFRKHYIRLFGAKEDL